MKELRELKERVENIEVTYNYEESYCNLKNDKLSESEVK